VTQWIENPEGGRARGPRAIVRAWYEVLVAPARFFRSAVAPADQAPGLTFLLGVVLVSEATRYWLVPGAAPSIGDRPLAGAVLGLALTVVLVAPVGLHLLVALQTLLLRPLVADRGGISETVQVMAYATAPCMFSGIPIPAVRLACAWYGFALLVVGLSVVHRAPLSRVLPAALLPGAVGFGYAFRGFGAAADLLEQVRRALDGPLGDLLAVTL